MNFSITYGTERVSFDISDKALPDELPLITPRRVDVTDAMRDIDGCIKRALENPVNSPRLKGIVGGRRVALMVSDEFRAGQQEAIIRCMMAEIAIGTPKEVWTFCSTGSHDPGIYAVNIAKWAEKYAAALGLNHRFLANDSSGNNFVNIGSCSDGTPVEIMKELLTCDVRAYGHEGKHHYMNGYSCIDKQLLPGLSSTRTIEGNHKNALDNVHSFGGRNVWVSDLSRQENRFSKGSFEARALADASYMGGGGRIIKKELPVFGLDMISDKKAIYWIAAGSVADISRQMTLEADKLSMFEVRPTRYVVISPGGPPASQSLYGTQNCFDMALSGAIEDGGEALIIAPCDGRPDLPEDTRGIAPDRKSKELFYDNLVRMKGWPIEKATKWIDKNFELYLWKTDRVLKLMNRRHVKLYLSSGLPAKTVRGAGLIPERDPQGWIDERTRRADSPIRVIDDGNKILVRSVL